jgi:hypothetical protein
MRICSKDGIKVVFVLTGQINSIEGGSSLVLGLIAVSSEGIICRGLKESHNSKINIALFRLGSIEPFVLSE